MGKNISALIKAIKENDFQLVKMILADGILLSEITDHSNTPLHVACEMGNHTLINLLKAHKASVDIANSRGESPLHCVIKSRNINAFMALISMNPNIDCRDDYGNTPLHIAVLEGQKEMLEILVKKGAKVNVLNENHETSLQMAEKYGDSRGANILKKAGAKKTMALFKALLESCKTSNVIRKILLGAMGLLYLGMIFTIPFVKGIAAAPIIISATALLIGLFLVVIDKPFSRVRSLEAKLFNGKMTCAEYEAVLYRNELLTLDNDVLNELEFEMPINDNLVYSKAINIDLDNNKIH